MRNQGVVILQLHHALDFVDASSFALLGPIGHDDLIRALLSLVEEDFAIAGVEEEEAVASAWPNLLSFHASIQVVRDFIQCVQARATEGHPFLRAFPIQQG